MDGLNSPTHGGRVALEPGRACVWAVIVAEFNGTCHNIFATMPLMVSCLMDSNLCLVAPPTILVVYGWENPCRVISAKAKACCIPSPELPLLSSVKPAWYALSWAPSWPSQGPTSAFLCWSRCSLLTKPMPGHTVHTTITRQGCNTCIILSNGLV